ncbi:MAG: hypothetical protein JXA36_08165 [Coriobacteriia bacterium]|nr:hypothetical protein [Coriobacteriia bacterium]
MKDHHVSSAVAAQRMAAQDRIPELVDYARELLGDHFGGVWVDVARDDQITMGLASGTAETKSAASQAISRAGLDGAVKTVDVRSSEQALAEAVADIARRLPDVNTHAPGDITVGIRTPGNAVRLSLPSDYPLTAGQRQFVNDTADKYGDALIIGQYEGHARDQACTYQTNPFCDPPLRGGITIAIDTPPSGRTCTGAFVARGNATNQLYQLTAGHCRTFDNTNLWWTYFTTGSQHNLGPFETSVINGFGDVGSIKILNSSGWDPRSWVFVTGGPDTTSNHQYRIRDDATPQVGNRICITGAFYGRSDCGDVTETAHCCPGNPPVGALIRANYCSTNGDSGAPTFAVNTAYGIHKGAYSACDTYGSRAQVAEQALDVHITHADD